MNERTIITGNKGSTSKLMIIALCLFSIGFLWFLLNIGDCREHHWDYTTYYGHTYTERSSRDFFEFLTFSFAEFSYLNYCMPVLIYAGVILGFWGIIHRLAYRSVSITVTDKRVYGTAAWGKRVDLPLDKISAVATSFGHGIAVATSSGSIRFKAITNNAEVHAAISKLLMERQEKAPAASEQKPTIVASQSNAEELKKFKELLDSGVITQEEFDAKKKQLLGI